MKKITLLFFVFLITITNSFSQKAYTENVSFKYEQLPLFILSAEKEYFCDVVLTYEEDVLAAKEEIRLENEQRDTQAQKEKEEWEKESTGSKILKAVVLDEKKPTGVAAHKKEPFLQKLWDKEELINKYLLIEGLKRNQDSKPEVIVFIESQSINYDPMTVKDKGSTFAASIDLAVRVEVYNALEEQVINETFKKVSKVHRANYYSTDSERDKDWAKNEKTILRGLEKDVLNKCMRSVQNYLNANVGFPVVQYEAPVQMVKEKKFSYTDVNSAYAIIAEAYAMIIDKDMTATRNQKINEAIAIWEKVLEESDPSDKKARINADVTAAIYLNLAEAYLWLNDYTKARTYMAKHVALNTRGFNREYKNIDELLISQKERFDANS